MEDLTGKQFGHYQIVAPLGEGGMAAVYKAYQPSMERYVAIKVLPRQMAESKEFQARFKREAKFLAQLQHTHILPVFDFGEADGYPYIVMPFVQGGTLANLMNMKRFSLPEIRKYISQIGGALDYAHERGMVHRDVKPSNVLVDPRGNCLLTDFGLARMAETDSKLTSSGSIMGTPAYMSPEQGMGKKLDHRSDIYSLGIILYEMVTGRVPYMAETPVAIVFKHVQDPLPPAHTFDSNVPEALELVLYKALAKQPEDRYQTVEEFVQALQNAIPESAPTSVAPPTASIPQVVEQKTIEEAAHEETKLEIQGEAEETPEKPDQTQVEPEAIKETAQAIEEPGQKQAEQETVKEIAQSTTAPIKPVLTQAGTVKAKRSFQKWIFFIAVGLIATCVCFAIGVPQIRSTVKVPVKFLLPDQRLSFSFGADVPLVKSVAFSPSGQLAASASTEGTQVWNVSDGTLLRTFGDYTDAVAFSPDGKTIVTDIYPGFQISRLSDGSLMQTLEEPEAIGNFVISPNGEFLATGLSDNTISVRRISDGSLFHILTDHLDIASSLAFSPDNKILASSSSNTIRLWNVSNGELIQTLNQHTGPVGSVAFSPDGQILASGSDDFTIRLWRVNDGKTITVINEPIQISYCVVFSPDGKTLASSGTDGIFLFRVSDGTLIQELNGASDSTMSIAFSPDGKILASGAYDGIVRLWNIEQ